MTIRSQIHKLMKNQNVDKKAENTAKIEKYGIN